MLQWMGGSRRKVATSRKSTHKRQKQYFEQRKRQQQTACLESYYDGKRLCTVQNENNRSLDILSLENVSTVAQEHNTSCTNGTPSSYATEAEYLEKKACFNPHLYRVSVDLPDRDEDLVANQNKLDSFKLSMAHKISVMDLLGDGGANSNAEENALHAQEAHVAFSVEGLGKVETETPVHSPKIPGRSSPNCFSPPKRTRRQPITSKHLDYSFNDLGSGLDINFSPHSSIDQPFCSRDMMNTVDIPDQTFTSRCNWNASNMQDDFGNDELVYNIDSSRNIWHGPSFLGNNIDDLGECESFSKNWLNQRDVGYDDYFHYKDPWKQDLDFEGWDLQMKRSSTKRAETFNMKDSSVSYAKRWIMEDFPGIIIPDTRWCSSIEIDHDDKKAVYQFAQEDTRESKSLLRFHILSPFYVQRLNSFLIF